MAFKKAQAAGKLKPAAAQRANCQLEIPAGAASPRFVATAMLCALEDVRLEEELVWAVTAGTALESAADDAASDCFLCLE